MSGLRLVACILAFLVAAPLCQSASTGWSLVIAPGSFVRSELPRPGDAAVVRNGGTLSGPPGHWGVIGWVEYDFSVPRDGWYELLVEPGAGAAEFEFDPDGERAAGYFHGAARSTDNTEKVGNVWLDQGPHRLRVQHYYWTGFARIASLVVRESGTAQAKSLRARVAGERLLFRMRQCAPLEVQLGGGDRPARAMVLVEELDRGVVFRQEIRAPAAARPVIRKVELPCERGGRFVAKFGGGEGPFKWHDVRPIDYEVIGGGPAAANSENPRTLLQEIDFTSQEPDYAGGGQTRVAGPPAARYRESGEQGFTRWQRMSEPVRKLLPEPSWFAYRIGPLEPQMPYLIEIEYPDDTLRTFAIALRERAPLQYPLAIGVDSGGTLAVSGKMQRLQMFFWPRSSDPRIVFSTAHDKRRAAAASARVYRVGTPEAAHGREGGRQFLNWYEEGENFLSLYGAPDGWVEAPSAGIDRWVLSLANHGFNVLSPAVAIYSFALYPSRFMRVFSRNDRDLLLRLLLTAERHGLKVLPELHPRADDVDLQFAGAPDPKPNLMVSKDGTTNYYSNDGRSRNYPPLHNPLHPANATWYLGVIGELIERYGDSPALLGVNLRLMPWANPALNNFHSLDWGYDDYTVDLFKRETGSRVPIGNLQDNQRFAARHQWLIANARAQWIEWRCEKITALYTLIRDRLREFRPDLKVYTSVFPWNDRADTADAWREAGVDLRRLAGLDGIVVIDADQGVGRREPEAEFEQSQRTALLRPGNFGLEGSDARSFLTGAYYIEATDLVVPPDAIGFPASTKRTWASAAAMPAGRHVLEPYAIQLADHDAVLLGVGGNGYALSNPLLREFVLEFRALPAQAFAPRSTPASPVVVRELARPGELVFYAVNRQARPVRVELRIAGASRIERLRDSASLAHAADRLVLDIDGFGLTSLRAVGNANIVSVSTSWPATATDRNQTNSR